MLRRIPRAQQTARVQLVLASKKHQTEEECIQAILKNPREIQWAQIQTPKICETAVKEDVRTLQFIKEPTADLLQMALRKNGYAIHFVKDQTEELCWMALKSPVCNHKHAETHVMSDEGVHSLAYIKNPTEAMIDYALDNCKCVDGSILECIPQEQMTEAFLRKYCLRQDCLRRGSDRELFFDQILRFIPAPSQAIVEFILERAGCAIRFVGPLDLTADLCEKAFATDSTAIRFIPSEFQTQVMVDMLLLKKEVDADIVYALDAKYRTQAFYNECILNAHIELFEDCPDEFKTPELCIQVLERDPYMLSFIPVGLQTPEMQRLAVSIQGNTLQYIPPTSRDESLCDLALQTSNGKAIQYVPVVLKSKERCMVAFEAHPELLPYIPKCMHTKEMCKKALESDPLLLRHSRFKTKELCEMAVKKKPACFRAVPSRHRSEALCLWVIENGIQHHWRLVLYFKPKDYTEAVCLALLKKSPNTISRFPKQFQTRDIHMMALKANPNSWKYIPKKIRSMELFETLLQEKPDAIEYFRKELYGRDPLYNEIKRAIKNR